MKSRHWLLLLSLLASAGAHAQLYKSVGPDGKVSYGDKPPTSAARVEEKAVGNGSTATTTFPFELGEAARKHPVTLYTAANCGACDDGRKALKARGIPFAERTVETNADIDQLKQAGGGKELPFLVVGNQRQTGYESETWSRTLTIAGYPSNSHLPRTYRYPPAQSAAPQAAKAAKSADESSRDDVAQRTTEPPPAAGNAPPGFRF